MDEDEFTQTAQQVHDAQHGDTEAMNDLFRRFVPRVARIVSARMGREWKGLGFDDDVLQDAFLDASRAIREGRICNGAAFTSWMAQTVQNKIQEMARAAHRQKRGGDRVIRFADFGESMLSASLFDGDDATPSEVAATRELEERLEGVLREISPRYREVICLRAYCRMSYREIAAEMGMPSDNTANALFLRARKELQRRLGHGSRD